VTPKAKATEGKLDNINGKKISKKAKQRFKKMFHMQTAGN
jgi:hypothetical protein